MQVRVWCCWILPLSLSLSPLPPPSSALSSGDHWSAKSDSPSLPLSSFPLLLFSLLQVFIFSRGRAQRWWKGPSLTHCCSKFAGGRKAGFSEGKSSGTLCVILTCSKSNSVRLYKFSLYETRRPLLWERERDWQSLFLPCPGGRKNRKIHRHTQGERERHKGAKRCAKERERKNLETSDLVLPDFKQRFIIYCALFA